MNVPVFVIGIGWLIVGTVILLRVGAATEIFQRDADRKGHPRGVFSRGSVFLGAVALVLVGVICVVTGVAG